MEPSYWAIFYSCYVVVEEVRGNGGEIEGNHHALIYWGKRVVSENGAATR